MQGSLHSPQSLSRLHSFLRYMNVILKVVLPHTKRWIYTLRTDYCIWFGFSAAVPSPLSSNSGVSRASPTSAGVRRQAVSSMCQAHDPTLWASFLSFKNLIKKKSQLQFGIILDFQQSRRTVSSSHIPLSFPIADVYWPIAGIIINDTLNFCWIFPISPVMSLLIPGSYPRYHTAFTYHDLALEKLTFHLTVPDGKKKRGFFEEVALTFTFTFTISHRKISLPGQRDNTMSRTFALYEANPGSIPGIPYGPPSSIRNDSWVQS